MINRLIEFFPDFSHLQESSLKSGDLDSLWQVTALDKDGVPFGSGFSKELKTARKIAVAEYIERNFVLSLKGSAESENWKFDKFPTSCGFAAGFDPLNTQIRSIGEAIERWALSQWIDIDRYIEQVMSPVWPRDSANLVGAFEEILVFKKEFIYTVNSKMIPYQLCVVLALSGSGAFIGSGVRSNFQDAMTHALVEAHRHLLISTQERNFNIYPYNRIKFFSENRSAALAAIHREKTTEWPQPVLEFQRSYQNELFCITRTIFKDWIPWERGSIDRMLY